jgi:uncharacterized membrane protein YfcA
VLAAIAITRLAGNVDAMRALNWLILAVIIASGILILLGMRRKAPATASQESSASRGRLAAGIALGFIAGALIGATGVGGGVAVIPILTGCFRLDMARTVGTSILIAVVLTLVASGVYQLLGHAGGVPSAAPAWSAAILMTCGSLAGVYAGARMGRRMPEKALQWAVLAMVLLAAGGMAAKVWSTA